jgi:phosphoribulokinase
MLVTNGIDKGLAVVGLPPCPAAAVGQAAVETILRQPAARVGLGVAHGDAVVRAAQFSALQAIVVNFGHAHHRHNSYHDEYNDTHVLGVLVASFGKAGGGWEREYTHNTNQVEIAINHVTILRHA